MSAGRDRDPAGWVAGWVAECGGVVLDLDGTLVDSNAAVLRGWTAWAEAVGAPTDGLARLVLGRSAADTITTLLPAVTAGDLRRHVRHVLSLQERDPRPVPPTAGAAALLARLAGHRWAVVTGCSAAMASARLTSGGLPRPDVLVTDEDVPAGKPDPAGYRLALGRLGLAAGDAVAVEDAPAGLAAAITAGLRTIAVTTTHPADELAGADVVVDSLADIVVTPARPGLRLSTAAGARS